jgi:TPR repeat protein
LKVASNFLVKGDFETSGFYCKLAADQKDPRGGFMVALVHSLGFGLMTDIDQNLKYAICAAESGNGFGFVIAALLLFSRNENTVAERYLHNFTQNFPPSTVHSVAGFCLSFIQQPFIPRVGIVCFIAASDRGCPEASTFLITLAHTINISEDDPNWKQKLLQAVEEHHPKSCIFLGNQAFTIGRNKIGIEWMLWALEKGNKEARTVITTRIRQSLFTRPELVHLATRVRELAQKSVKRAQELYGMFLNFGWGVRQNVVPAFDYFRMLWDWNATGYRISQVFLPIGIGQNR